jgi:predicted kinase
MRLEKRAEQVLQCVMTIGAPRSGKSLFVEQKYPHYHRLNSDQLNSEKTSDHKLDQFKQEISRQLGKKSSVVVDGTHLDIHVRQQLANHIRQEGAQLKYIFFECSLAQIKVQNRLSSTPLDESEIQEAYKQLHFPHPWEANQQEIV